MPRISLIDVPLYQPLDPYNNEVDNRPLVGILDRIQAVNSATDNNSGTLGAAAGTAGSVANRINQSLEDNGDLMVAAIDAANHSIEAHVDTADFVRMTVAERAKLSLIASEATNLGVLISTTTGDIVFESGQLVFEASDSIDWVYQGGRVSPHTSFPAAVRHTHYYGLVPVDQNQIVPTEQDYYVTSVATPYREDSLRVYVNGVRLSPNVVTYVSHGLPTTTDYTAMTYTEDAATGGVVTSGGFSLSVPLPAAAAIVVDFDVSYS